MRIGIPRETRDGETRVAATPETVKKYAGAGHQVLVEHDVTVVLLEREGRFAPIPRRVSGIGEREVAPIVVVPWLCAIKRTIRIKIAKGMIRL